ncbi:hypothetical protein AWM75_08185 [Aerococcus urinaehominis]|uniref:Uncharacterized protein n=1 Tax=Aerococcus urinaehominis TaxID=128944 RepID=A0A0X8FMS6_9LACT|nr:DMT family transporter [Aerococcus urinaehominis]AMB99949.1 hypothetical protein AWM75_08185 [Aerococcus urinaehominis]SDM42187.1 EamA domain-containing membrane protein RarD [Aerococcus urinaehominis]
MHKEKASWQGYLWIMLAGISWGTGGFFVTKLAQAGVSSSFTAFSGHFLAIWPLALVLLARGGWSALKISKRGLIFAILMGIVGKGLFLVSYNRTIQLAGVSTASILLYTSPLFTSLLSVLIFKSRLTKQQILALALNLVAAFLVVTGGQVNQLNISALALVLGITAAGLYALNTILGKFATQGDDPLVMTFYMLVFSCLTIANFADPVNQVRLLDSWPLWGLVIVNSIIASVVANTAYLRGLSLPVDPARVSIVASIELVVANLIGVLVFKEAFNLTKGVGICLLVGSILLMNWVPKAKDLDEAQS